MYLYRYSFLDNFLSRGDALISFYFHQKAVKVVYVIYNINITHKVYKTFTCQNKITIENICFSMIGVTLSLAPSDSPRVIARQNAPSDSPRVIARQKASYDSPKVIARQNASSDS